jgi:SAM-dependent methyltransferase
LSGLDLLDVGCGVRFTQTLINRSIPFGSYTGLEVSLPIVQWLREHVERNDDRFKFVHWNVQNALYNDGPSALPMLSHLVLPVRGTFDVVTGFSLFTHLYPEDAAQMLRLMRKSVRPDGLLFFSALCHDKSVETFNDVDPNHPLAEVRYSRTYLGSMLPQAGWELVSYESRHFLLPIHSCADRRSLSQISPRPLRLERNHTPAPSLPGKSLLLPTQMYLCATCK